jgi:alanine-alpha-ketoisovalerate/valine-pyruvate aminotransferase
MTEQKAGFSFWTLSFKLFNSISSIIILNLSQPTNRCDNVITDE